MVGVETTVWWIKVENKQSGKGEARSRLGVCIFNFCIVFNKLEGHGNQTYRKNREIRSKCENSSM
jgi:hypothetical protein